MNFKSEMEFESITLGSKVVVSDPCYDRTTWCMGSIDNVLEGKYNTKIYFWKPEEPRVSELKVFHENEKETTWERQDFTVGVDSGQAGIFCDSVYPQGDPGDWDGQGGWYDVCCNATNNGYNERDNWLQMERDIQLFKTNKFHKEIMLEILNDNLKYAREHENDKLEKGEEPLYTVKELEDKIKIYETGILPEKPEWIKGGTVYEKGVVSCTGFGDGSYTCYTCKNSEGKVVGIKIVYIGNEEEEENE